MTLLKNNFLCLDVGDVRIGVAVAGVTARIASPLTTLMNDANIWDNLNKIIADEAIGILVIGLPRNLSGNDTDQTRKVREFAEQAKSTTSCAVFLHDEALTSVVAEEELKNRRKPYSKSDIDALAAGLILEDYLQTQERT